MAFSSGQLAEAERRFSEALAEARDDPDRQPLAAMIANRLAGTYTLLGDGEQVMTFGRWALGTGCLDAAAASQTRTLIAIGASQVAGPPAALAEPAPDVLLEPVIGWAHLGISDSQWFLSG